MSVIIVIIVWLFICVLISYILTGGSDAASVLTWVIFFGVPIVYAIYSIVKATGGARHESKDSSESLQPNERSTKSHGPPHPNDLLKNDNPIPVHDVKMWPDDHFNATPADDETPRKLLNTRLASCILVRRNDLLNNSRDDQSVQVKQNAKTNAKSEMAAFILEDPVVSPYAPAKITRPANASSPSARIKSMRKLRVHSDSLIRVYINKDAELFILQAQFMADFEDNYWKSVPFQCYNPTYSDMSDEQLRCYFTWRSKIRKGIVTETSLSYVYVYIYELLNNIGTDSSMDAIEKMAFIWREYRKIDDHLDRYLAHWIKDYYIVNEFAVSFKNIVEELRLNEHYPEVLLDEKDDKPVPSELIRLSNYKVEKSKFLTDENIPLLEKCLDYVVDNLRPLFDMYGLSLGEIIVGKSEQQNWWQPFSSAVYHPVRIQNKQISISRLESYECINGKWTCYKPGGFNSAAAAFIGYVVKRTEARLRIASGYKYKLSPDVNTLLQTIQSNYYATQSLVLLIRDENFDNIIDLATSINYKNIGTDDTSETAPVLTPLSIELAHMVEFEPYSLFREMRKITCNEKSRDGEAQQFYDQAKLLAELSDDYSGAVSGENMLSVPTYAKMTNTQLRSYFTWRTKVRAGEKPETVYPNIILYAFELINHLGAIDSEAVVRELTSLLTAYGDFNRNIDKLIPTLIKDYYLCNNFGCSFAELAQKYHIKQYYPNIFLSIEYSGDRYALYNRISNYRIERSRFYTEITAPVIRACFNFVIERIIVYIKNEGLSFDRLIIGKGVPDRWWRPFRNAVYCGDMPSANRTVTIGENESYQYENGEWTCLSAPQIDPAGPRIIGYIFKRMEAKMREITRFKYKLSPDAATIINSLPDGTLNYEQILRILSDSGFDEAIDNAVLDYFEINHSQALLRPEAIFEPPVNVNIDVGQLDHIRKGAEENQAKLTVQYEDESFEYEAEPDDFTESDDVYALHDSLPQTGWEGLYETLSEIQKQALAIVVSGEQPTKRLFSLASGNGMMVEVLIESINERSLDYVGDSIIEVGDGNPYIYDDYKGDIRAILGRTV